MKFYKYWFAIALVPVAAVSYWAVYVRPFLQIGYARLVSPIVDIHAESMGMLAGFHQDLGGWVEKGDALCSLNAVEERKSLLELQNKIGSLHESLSSCLAEVEDAMQEYLNARSDEVLGLENRSGVSLANLELRQRAAEQCKLEMKDLESKVELAKSAIQQKNVTSPFSGFIVERMKREGELVAIGDLICSLCNSKTIWIEAIVPETYASKIRIGQTAIATLPFDSAVRCKGTISWVSPVALPDHAGIPIRISLKEGYPDCLRPNLQVQLTLKVH